MESVTQKHITKTAEGGLAVIKKYESFEAKAYLCPAHVATIGYGATYYPLDWSRIELRGKRVKLSDPAITEAEASTLLAMMIGHYELAVDSFTRDDINQNQFDALVSFAYNVGTGALKSSTLLRKVNANPNDPAILKEFAKWNKAKGKTLPGLVKRRQEESKLYFS